MLPRLSLLLALVVGLCTSELSERDKRRIDCHPEPDANQQNCEARGCQWVPAGDGSDKYLPWCFFKDGMGYVVSSSSGSNYKLQKNKGTPNPWGDDFQTVDMDVKSYGSVLNVKIHQAGRWEPNLDMPQESVPSSDSLQISVDNSSDPFSFSVIRQSTGRKIFDTSIGGLIFSDKFIQIATYLPSDKMYGWGESIHHTINHDLSRYLVWGMFARDEPPNSDGLDVKNLYGAHPFYMVVEPDGNTHGVLIMNSNAQEVRTLPAPGFVYRTTGGNLDMYFFPGPTPVEVNRQYLSFVGKPMLPAYWSLGYQICRYGYKSLQEVNDTISSIRAAGIPIDVSMIDIDYMDRYKDFTIGKDFTGLGDFANQLHKWGMHLILIWDPAIEATYDSFSRGLHSGARFIEWEKESQVQREVQDLYPLAKDTKVMLGVVWPDNHVAFPDFMEPSGKTSQWWSDEFKKFHDLVPFDGAWIDMNEPSVFGTNEAHPWYFDNPDHPNDTALVCPTSGPDAVWENAPYLTNAVYNFGRDAHLYTKTLCMLATTNGGTERLYNTKNLYGFGESRATQKAVYSSTGKRGTIISRNTFPSGGRYAGHWLGDNTARWQDLQTSVVGAQEFNLFGYPYVGSDICGFIGATNEQLCLRWQQMGSFHSFMRNHNNNNSPPQQPTIWPTVAAATKKQNLFRYRHLPYLYSLHFAASLNGGTVIRPMFFEFPQDDTAHSLSHQFMWGPAVLVAPVITQDADSVRAYLPDGNWYSIYDYATYQSVSIGWNTYAAPTTSNVPAFVRGGYILPRQDPGVTTVASRNNPFQLLVALDNHHLAQGELYWDDGDTIVNDFNAHNFYHYNFTFVHSPTFSSLVIKTSRKGNLTLPTLDLIEILGYNSYVDFSTFTLNGKKVNINTQKSSYNAFKKVLTINTPQLIDLTASDSIILSWKTTSVVLSGEENDSNTFYRVY